ncbi:MAG: GNAT family N-acetyltransferase, partial [Gammaproteobacteria bacterium]|nr:GNAT family N-acetyltransferase [Gammaproteobacteria bacterium]
PYSPYRIESDRLTARCWSPEDAEAFRALLDRNNDHLRPFIPWMADEPRSLEQTRERLRKDSLRFTDNDDYRYALLDRGGILIGEMILSTRSGGNSREVGYLLDKETIGRGLATEAAAMLIKAAFVHCKVDHVDLHCSPRNTASIRIAEKLGFKLLKIEEKSMTDSEGLVDDSMHWRLGSGDFPGSLAAGIDIRAFDGHGNQLQD